MDKLVQDKNKIKQAFQLTSEKEYRELKLHRKAEIEVDIFENTARAF